MPITKIKFQCFLIIGQSTKTREKSKQIAQTLGIDLKKVSPDISIIKAQKNTVSISDIRSIKSTIFQKPLLEKLKVTIIEDAHLMSHEAQNALLKLLEEPPTHALIILESQNKEGILKTIQSRVINMNLPKLRSGLSQKPPEPYSPKEAIMKISEIEDPEEWLDEEIIKMYNSLKKGKQNPQILETLEAAIESKKMLKSNVYPKFVIMDFFLKTANLK